MDDLGAGRHAHATDKAAAEIADDVAEHVFHHQNVEGPGLADEIERLGVDVVAAGLDVGKAFRHLVEYPAEERHGFEDIRLVDAGHECLAAPCLALAGKVEGEGMELLGSGAGDPQGFPHLVGGLRRDL